MLLRSKMIQNVVENENFYDIIFNLFLNLFKIVKRNKSVNLIYFLCAYHIHDKEISLPFEYHLHLAKQVERIVVYLIPS